jgi:hypothetical protein
MDKRPAYSCEDSTMVDGVFIDANMPFLTDSERQPDWRRIPAGARFSPGLPYTGPFAVPTDAKA